MKTPPADQDVERDLVASILVDDEALAATGTLVSAADFTSPKYRELFEVALALDEAGEVPDVTTMVGELRRRGSKLDALWIRDVAADAPAVPRSAAPRRARTIARLAAQRALMSRLASGIEQAQTDGIDPREIAADVAADVLDLTAARSTEVREFGPLVAEALDDLEREATGQIAPAALTGFRGVDRTIGGLRQGWLTLVAARPGVGKTSFAAAIARNVAVHRPVLVFSLEMGADEVAMRLLCSEAGVGFDAIRSGRAGLDDWNRLVESVGPLSSLPLRIDDSPVATVAEIRARVRQAPDVGLVVIDYLQLMGGNRGGRSTRQEEVAEISRGLKILARELEVPILACCQLNREVDRRSDARPKLSDLRESGALEQDADVVILLHRDGDDPGRVDAIVAKHRSGPTGSVKLRFEYQYTRFKDWGEDTDGRL